MKAEHALASPIFISRRHNRTANDTKSGKRREINARLSFNEACELGFRGSLDEWDDGRGCNAVVRLDNITPTISPMGVDNPAPPMTRDGAAIAPRPSSRSLSAP
jgi:hypothetical protein